MSAKKDYYATLGVAKDADDKALKRAYRKLAVQWHPDKNQGNVDEATAKFKEIGEAYEVLSDPSRRQMYDQFGADGLSGMGGGMPEGFAGFKACNPHKIFETFFGGEDPFAAMFGAGGGGGVHGMKFGAMPAGAGGGGLPPGIAEMMGGMMGGGGGGGAGGALPPGIAEMMGGMMGGGGGMGGGGIPPGLAQMFGGGAAGGGGGGNAPSPGARHDRLPPGTRVRLKNLKGGAEHNGKHGLLAEYNDSKGRYVVNMEGEGKNLSLKPANLQQCVPKCEVMGLVSRPDLNGLEGCVLDFDEETGRYLFELPPSHHKDTASFKAANVILPDETRVLICGLSSQGQYNGTMGKVVSYDRPAGRYVVQVGASQHIKLKPINVRA